MPGQTWTDFDERLLAKYAEYGRSLSYAARGLGRSPRAVACKASALQIKFHGQRGRPRKQSVEAQRITNYFWTDNDKRCLAGFAEKGCSMSYVARKLSRSRRAIIMMASRLQISFHGKPGAPTGNKNAAGRHRQKFSWGDL